MGGGDVERKEKRKRQTIEISLLLADSRGGRSSGSDLLVPGTRVHITQALRHGHNLVAQALDIVNRPRSHQLDSALIGIVVESHVSSALGSGVDNGGVLELLSLHQGIIGQLMGGGVVIDIGIGGGNVPGGDDVAEALEGALDLQIVSVAVTESAVTIRRAHVAGYDAEDVLEGLFELGHLKGDAVDGQLGELGMGPGVGGDLVAFIEGAFEDGLDLGVVNALLVVSVDEEGDLDVLLCEEVQEAVGVLYIMGCG